MMSTAAADQQTISLPALAVLCGVTPDKLRVLARRTPALRGLFRAVGRTQFIEVADLDRARELIDAANSPGASSGTDGAAGATDDRSSPAT
jgi:hypothetical protein